MDGGLFSPNTMSAAPHDSAMDIDYIDELLLEGCWLQTTDGSEFLHHSPLFDPFIWSNFEANNGESSLLCQTPLQKDTEEERKRSSFYESLSTSESHGQNPTKSPTDLVGCSDHSRRWWIGPEKNLSPGFSVMGRLIRALSYIKESTRNKDALIQIWVPVNRGGRQYLTTNDQPFSLDLNFPSLASYRKISVNYQFPTDENSEEIVGLPGRVFKGKVPEWTPDVRFFRRDEYARVNDAQQFGVGGTIALPVFEQGSRNCLGVIEVVMTTPKINYRPEIETVCKALEAVDLTSSDILSIQNLKAFNGSYQAALPEIWEVLRSACGTHNLPLAQVWVPCIQQGKVGSRHSDENYIRCVSTVDSACYIANPQMQTFHEACSEYHLLKGEGIVGQAFMTNQPCFSSDIASYPKTEYPLSHHAKMFNLHAAVAIRFRSIYTGKNDFVLEFFLPVNCSDLEDQKELLTSLSLIIQKVCRSLRVITDEELEEEKALPVDGVILTKSSDDQQPQDDSLKTSAGFIGDFSTFDEGSLTIASKRGEKRHAKGEKTITLEVLRQYFAGSLKDAAKSIGVCPTTLKRICRQHGIKRWPSRKIKKVGHSLEKLQRVINSVQGASGSLQIESFYTNFPDLASQKSSSSSPFSTSKLDDHSKPSNVHPKSDTFTPRGTGSISPSSSCSQSSSSSQCCSSGIQPHPYPLNISSSEDPITKEHSGNSVLKRVRSEAEIHASSDEVLEFLPRSQSHISLTKRPNPEPFPLIPRSDGGNSREGHALRIKVSYGEEKIRFRFQNIWKYENLSKEIARRFGIYHMDAFHMKYLDDDSEWVLLTCDADLEECVDLCGPAQNNTIKLLLSRVPQRQSGSSFGCYSTS